MRSDLPGDTSSQRYAMICAQSTAAPALPAFTPDFREAHMAPSPLLAQQRPRMSIRAI